MYIGSRVIYHGSLADLHGRAFTLLPCTWDGACAKCDQARRDGDPEGWPAVRYSLHTCDAAVVRHVRPTSVTPEPGWYPTGAVELAIGAHRYLACHTTPGGGADGRIVHFHIAGDPRGGFTWCRVPVVDDTVRRLDAAGRRCLVTVP